MPESLNRCSSSFIKKIIFVLKHCILITYRFFPSSKWFKMYCILVKKKMLPTVPGSKKKKVPCVLFTIKKLLKYFPITSCLIGHSLFGLTWRVVKYTQYPQGGMAHDVKWWYWELLISAYCMSVTFLGCFVHIILSHNYAMKSVLILPFHRSGKREHRDNQVLIQ